MILLFYCTSLALYINPLRMFTHVQFRPEHVHLDDLEDLYLVEQRLINIRAGKTQTVSLEEVMKRYGMES